jgi:hypothetical protein
MRFAFNNDFDMRALQGFGDFGFYLCKFFFRFWDQIESIMFLLLLKFLTEKYLSFGLKDRNTDQSAAVFVCKLKFVGQSTCL